MLWQEVVNHAVNVMLILGILMIVGKTIVALIIANRMD